MKENSIEDRINNAYCFLNSMHSDFRTGLYYKEDLENLEHILSDYKRVLKENEELKEKERSRIIGKYGDAEIHDVINRTLSNDYIPVQKVKDKIEEILNNGEYRIIFEGDAEFPDEATCIDAQKYIKLEKLQELLEGRK